MTHKKELYEYRARLLERTRAAAKEFCAACRNMPTPRQPIYEGGWNLHQMVAHVRDMEAQVYELRLRRTFNENQPHFPNFDADAWMSEHYRPDEPLEDMLDSFQANIRATVDWLEYLPPEAWSRHSRHEVMGEFTLQAWAERGLAHIEEHLKAVKQKMTP